MTIVRFLQRLRRVYISVWGCVDVEISMHYRPKHVVSLLEYNNFLLVVLIDYTFLPLIIYTHTTGMTHLKETEQVRGGVFWMRVGVSPQTMWPGQCVLDVSPHLCGLDCATVARIAKCSFCDVLVWTTHSWFPVWQWGGCFQHVAITKCYRLVANCVSTRTTHIHIHTYMCTHTHTHTHALTHSHTPA